MSLWTYIRENMLKHITQTVCEDKAAMTYEELVVFAEMFAKKITGESSCAIYCQSEMAASMALLACFAARVTAVPLPVRYGERHCQRILDTIDPTCCITDAGGELSICRLTGSRYRSPSQPPSLIMCTSGTTGVPKGVMLSERNIQTNVRDIADYFSIGREDTILISRPLYHAAVLTGEFLTSLINGVNIRFYSQPFQPSLLLRSIEKHTITAFCSTPTLVNLLARLSQNRELPLKHISISGECMSEATRQSIRKAFPTAKIYFVYGLTEASPRISYLPPEYFDEMPACVGVPLPGVQLKIVGSDGCEVAHGEEGILWVRGDNVMTGYYQEPELTQKILRNGWLCTGDIACKNERGWLTIKGRSDEMIIRAGMNIYPQEIEAALQKDPRTKEVLAYGVADPKKGVQIAIDISGDFKDVKDVKQMCINTLLPYQIPTLITLVDELPKNGSGKIIRGGQHAGT